MDELVIILSVVSVLVCPWALGFMKSLKDTKTRRAVHDVSVIITARNDKAKIKKHIAAVYTSLGEETQIIVVDRGSEDGTAEEAEGYGCDVVRLGKDASPNDARFAGSKRAVYPLLMFLDGNLVASSELFLRLSYLYTTHTVLSVSPYLMSSSPAWGLFGFARLLRVISLGGLVAKKAKLRGLFEECMMVGRSDYLGACTHHAVPEGADTGAFLASSYARRGMRVRNYFGDEFLGKASEDAAAETAVPLLWPGTVYAMLMLLGSAMIPLRLARALGSMQDLVFWGWMFILYGSTYVTFLKKTGEYSVFWGVLFPAQACLAIVWRITLLIRGFVKAHAPSMRQEGGSQKQRSEA